MLCIQYTSYTVVCTIYTILYYSMLYYTLYTVVIVYIYLHYSYGISTYCELAFFHMLNFKPSRQILKKLPPARALQRA